LTLGDSKVDTEESRRQSVDTGPGEASVKTSQGEEERQKLQPPKWVPKRNYLSLDAMYSKCAWMVYWINCADSNGYSLSGHAVDATEEYLKVKMRMTGSDGSGRLSG